MTNMNGTFIVWISHYIDHIQTKTYSKNTIEACGCTVKLFGPYKSCIGETDDITPDNTEIFKKYGLNAGIATAARPEEPQEGRE